MDFFAIAFIFVLAGFLGFELISRVPSQLHTPLMSGSNAISGIVLIGAILALENTGGSTVITVFGFLATVFATVNVVSGYCVTDRMLKMFSHGKK
jgi:NAD(P) transhydrogenase subunit alpha